MNTVSDPPLYAEHICAGGNMAMELERVSRRRYAMSAMSIRVQGNYGKKLYFGSQDCFFPNGRIVLQKISCWISYPENLWRFGNHLIEQCEIEENADMETIEDSLDAISSL